MNIDELKAKLYTPIEENETWLQNQWPARPNQRLSEYTYLNYQNLQNVFGPEARKKMESAVAEHPEVQVVVVAVLNKSGRLKGPRSFLEEWADYYSQYELFASAAGMPGFVEVFHNLKRERA